MTHQAERRTRFRARLDTERLFLGTINKKFSVSVPLMGMTRQAIVSWHKTVNIVVPCSQVNSIVSLLLEAGKRADILADDSREVFEPDGTEKIGSLGDLHLMISALIEELKEE